MQIFFTKSFKKDYNNVPANIQKAFAKLLAWLLENPNHPSTN